jgi:phage FluMu protein Com
MSRTEISLKVIPAPTAGTRTALEMQGAFPAFRGTGGTDLVCGHCKQVLVEGIGSDAVIKNIVIKCPKCQKYNEMPQLSLSDIKQKIVVHLETALGVKDFKITYAKLEGDRWKINIEYNEKMGNLDIAKSGMFALDAITGEVLEFKRDYSRGF